MKNTVSLRIDSKDVTHKDTIANISNRYFLSIAESLNSENNKHSDIKSHCGPGVDSASNRNEYQDYFLGVKAAGA